MFKLSMDQSSLVKYVTKQLNFHFPDGDIRSECLSSAVEKALKRTEYCFSKVNLKYFFDGESVIFNHLNTDQYAMFLYYLSNTIWREEKDSILASKVYYLNKALHGFDAFYEVDLPDIFLLTHPVGTVLGRGTYQNYFIAYQRVTVGGNPKLKYPTLGKGVAMYGGSALIGNCQVGDNCLISIGTIVMDQQIPQNMVVFGKYPDVSYKKAKRSVIDRYFI
mgnify:CR=1 FL=1